MSLDGFCHGELLVSGYMKTFFLIVGLLAFLAYQVLAQTTHTDKIISIEPARMCAEPVRPIRDREVDCLRGLIRSVHSEIVPPVNRHDTYVNGQATQTRDITYDSWGNAVERIIYGLDSNYQKHVDSRVVYNFDGQGRATGWEDYADGRPVPTKSIYRYDARGNRVRETVTQADGKIRAVLTLIYDTKGRNIEKRYEHSEFTPYINRIVSVYDPKGNLIQSTSFSNEGKLTSKSIANFDAQGNRIEVEGYTVNSNQEAVLSNRTSYEYDDKGVIKGSESYGADGARINKVVYKYNDHGDLSSITSYGKDRTFSGRSLFDYQYDSRGNWIRCTHLHQKAETSEPEAYYAEIRTIAYY
jgi:hypothetical protein